MTIKVSMAAAVDGGETLSDAFSLDVAHTSLSGTIAGGGHLVFSLQPDSGDRVKLLFLTADNYENENLTYQIQADGTAATAPLGLKLTEPHLLIGDTVNAVYSRFPATWHFGMRVPRISKSISWSAEMPLSPQHLCQLPRFEAGPLPAHEDPLPYQVQAV